MTPAAFQTAFQPYADQAAAGTGLLPGLFLAQWAVETAYASSFAGWYNLGNITRGGASNGFVNYGSYAQFTEAEILLLHDAPYAGVLASAGKSLGEQCVALGQSPWDAGHYNNGGGPGSSLIAVLPVFGMNAQTTGVEVLDIINDPVAKDWNDYLLRIIYALQITATGYGKESQAVSEALAAMKTELDALKAQVAALSQPTVTIPTQITLTGSLHS